MTGKPAKPEALEKRRKAVETTLEHLEQIWLKDRPFMATKDKPSIADLLAVCELEQPCEHSNKNELDNVADVGYWR